MRWVIALLAAFVLGTSASVDAQGVTEVVVTGTKAPVGSETRTKTVSYADLDLSKSAGLGTLLDRIHSAANDVCSPAPSGPNARESAEFKGCVRHALNSALRELNNPRLTAMASHGVH